MPPKDLKKMNSLMEAGADTIGLHVETLDPHIYANMCPGKANDIKIDYYYKAWKEAVDIFGESQVSTFIILGLGENEQTTFNGIEKLVRLGCIPFIVPFTPIIGSELENHPSPSTEYMRKMYRNVASIICDYGVDIRKNKAGCVRCGACSAIYEALYMDKDIKIR
jgi:radical SAM protein (TIGR04043 family)